MTQHTAIHAQEPPATTDAPFSKGASCPRRLAMVGRRARTPNCCVAAWRCASRIAVACTLAIAFVAGAGCRGKGSAAAASDTTAAAAPAAASAGHADADTGGADKAQDAAGGGDDDEAAVPPVVGAHTAVVARQAFDESITAIGVVAPRPGHYAELAPAAAARVARIFVAPGDHVNAGDSLVEFERAPFDAAAASADAALTMAQHAYDRAQRLAAAGIAARKDVDQAAADLASARSTDVAAQRAQQLATLRAPFSGVVTRLSAVLGATADPGQPVASIADPNALDLVFSLSAGEAARVRSGATVTLTSGQGVHGDALGQAVVSTVGAALDSTTRTVAIRARLTRPARALRIGETIFGRIDVGVRRDAATVPVQALVPDGDGLKVFVVGTDGIAHARAVVVGGRTETTAEIVDGVHPGETVVTDGAYGVEDRAKVVPVR
jgi:RND family efflux transporter MFP subunit